jgi:hypothetical protein
MTAPGRFLSVMVVKRVGQDQCKWVDRFVQLPPLGVAVSQLTFEAIGALVTSGTALRSCAAARYWNSAAAS